MKVGATGFARAWRVVGGNEDFAEGLEGGEVVGGEDEG